MNKCAFVDIPSLYKDIQGEIVAALTLMIDNGDFVGGQALSDFEMELAEYTGSKYAIGCSDGTFAVQCALLAAGIKPGDKVVVPVNSFIATAFSVIHARGEVVFVDCCSDTFLLDINQTETALKQGAKFVIPVHLYGNPCEMDVILDLAHKYNAIVIEDNAQALGAAYNGQKTGTFGAASGISFYPAKNIGAFGQGGALLTNDAMIRKTSRMLTEQGQGEKRYYHELIGYNGRLDSLQAKVLSFMLKKLDNFIVKRKEIARLYEDRLGVDKIQKKTPNGSHVYHLFEYRCESKFSRERLCEVLKGNDLPFAFHYPVPIHKQAAFLSCNNQSYPFAESLAETLISLPIHPNMSFDHVDEICSHILRIGA